MDTLTLASYETVITAAFDHWLGQDPNSFHITLEGYDVLVDIRLVDDRFNCGIPGYNMANKDVEALSAWVPSNVEKNGNRGQLARCKDGVVNAWLKGGVYIMFNFHINLVGPC